VTLTLPTNTEFMVIFETKIFTYGDNGGWRRNHVDMRNTSVLTGVSGEGAILSQQFGRLPSVDGRQTYLAAFQAQGLLVPEASTWAMLIAGFGLIGAMARRARAVAKLA
jgi:hypothetical protein